MRNMPMLMSAPMVRAILAGRKNQTRRLKFTGAPGDLVWVKETWRVSAMYDGTKPSLLTPRGMTVVYDAGGSAANDEPLERPHGGPAGLWNAAVDWPSPGERPTWLSRNPRVSIHMPKWASRLTLKVGEVRSEPLQWITDEDAIAEGLQRIGDGWGLDELPEIWHRSPRLAYGGLWAALHGQESWDENPSVSVISFAASRTNVLDWAGVA